MLEVTRLVVFAPLKMKYVAPSYQTVERKFLPRPEWSLHSPVSSGWECRESGQTPPCQSVQLSVRTITAPDGAQSIIKQVHPSMLSLKKAKCSSALLLAPFTVPGYEILWWGGSTWTAWPLQVCSQHTGWGSGGWSPQSRGLRPASPAGSAAVALQRTSGQCDTAPWGRET